VRYDTLYKRVRCFVVILFALGAGCAPTIPFAMVETADVLARNQVSVTIAGGGGGGSSITSNAKSSFCCGGGDLRVSVGVGRKQEVGADVAVLGQHGALYPSGKLRHKVGLVRHLALVTGVGGSGAIALDAGGKNSPLYLGADAALVASTDRIDGMQLYGGLRATFALPASAQFYQNLPTEGVTVPLGLAIHLGARGRLFIEAGLLVGASQYESQYTKLETTAWVGGYGALAFQLTTPGAR
jgi:hypothetical protein